ncbi:MAG: AraC family transcriptional regulator [Streptosporangiaceae bacterium]
MRRWARFLTPTAGHRRLGLVCLGVGHQRGAIPPCPPRVLGCYGAVLVTEGRGRLGWGRPAAAHDLSAPTLFWLAPGVPHTYAPAPPGWTEAWVLFEGRVARAYEDLGYISRGDPVVALADPLPLRRAFRRLIETCQGEPPGVDVEAAALVHALILAARHAQGGSPDPDDDAIVAALRDDACRPLTVTQHARDLGVPPGRLRDIVRRAAGCTPKEYILRTRLNRAKTLLAGSDLTIAKIGRTVGYDDPAYFTRVFVRRAGISPRTFREQQRR